ncbi:MAG: hypothetical protein R6V75_07725 [Bacteroidales bacterium]
MKNRKWIFVFISLAVLLPVSDEASGQDIPMLAYEMRMNGDPHGAIALLDSALLLYPDSARMWFEKGRCVDWTKMEGCSKFTHTWKYVVPRLKSGRRCFSKAVALEPDNARYHYWASQNGSLLAFTGIYSPWKWPVVPFLFRRMVNEAESAVELDPGNPEYRFQLVVLSRFGGLLGGNKKMARAHADTLDRIDPVYGTMAYKELETKKHPYDSYHRYLELEGEHPDHPMLLQKLAQINSNSGPEHFSTARHYYRRMLELDPENTLAIKELVRTMNRYGQDGAVGEIQSYLRNVGSSYLYYQAVGHQLIGQQYQRLGSRSLADEHFRLAARMNPSNNSTNITDLKRPEK